MIPTISRPRFISVSPPGTTLLSAWSPRSMASLRKCRQTTWPKTNNWRSLLGINNQTRREHTVTVTNIPITPRGLEHAVRRRARKNLHILQNTDKRDKRRHVRRPRCNSCRHWEQSLTCSPSTPWWWFLGWRRRWRTSSAWGCTNTRD